MAKRRRNPRKVIIELTMSGSLDTAAEVIDDLLDAGSIQDMINEALEEDEESWSVSRTPPRITNAKVFVED